MLKGAGQEELLAAIRSVAAGGAVFGEGVAARVLTTLSGNTPTHDGLTAREAEVLAMMGRGWDNPRIARELHVSLKTVQNHVSRVLLKLHARDRVEAVLRARGESGGGIVGG